ncbi:MAG TPA: hypothetical protein EYP57_03460 [Thermodesulfobacteriaceae bacterium]|nr:hypothetical protein [Thermodesulfobacteriaceae bacterium]
MKRFILFTTATVVALFTTASPGAETVLLMKGVEIAKGRDMGDVRYGTKFAGEILDGTFAEMGYWYITLDYRGAEYVEVCNGENDIVRARMTVVLDGSGGRSGMMILFMRDRHGIPDVYWNYSAPLCGLGGMGCPYPWEEPVEGCLFEDYPDEYGPVAQVRGETGPIFLWKVFATGFFRGFRGASFTGWLRHNYPFIPRVEGTLIFHGR